MEPERWSALWSLMLDRWDADKSTEVGAVYLDQLSARLSPEQIQAGVEAALYQCTYFPSPREIVEEAIGSEETRAAAQWELCQRVMEGDAHVLDRMTDAGRKTVRLMGGTDRLRNTKLDEVHFRRQEFMRLYGHASEIAARERNEIGPWSEEGRETMGRLLKESGMEP